ncbi:MAG: FAD-dependent monooxygenase [Saprospiraceae bacterium]|nr:FAD-dependent monooxygenase [Saprospiraceae bacterium]
MAPIIIIGSGLCGTLMALRMAQKGYQVDVYEKRPDMRNANIGSGRSINLALSDRGLSGLEMVGLREKALELVIPMKGRLIHDLKGNQQFFSYSGRQGEVINSISRKGLNILLMDEAEKTGKIRFFFRHECSDVDFDQGNAIVKNLDTNRETTISGEVILGTDGAFSAVRQAMMRQSGALRFQYSQSFLDTGYKELTIPASDEGGFRLEKNALHIWPREGFMLIALPNLDKSFTVTLFLPFEGDYSFEKLKSDEEIESFFKTWFPTAYQHMPDLLQDFRDNPASSLCTVKCFPWQVGGKVALMGDAAHAVVPFYGQGMNASFEDCVVLDECMDKYPGDWQKILKNYEAKRKVNGDAIGDLAVDNFYEMKAATADPVFVLKRRIELDLEQNFPDYFSKYSMVTFREDLPYKTAMDQGRLQDSVLMDYARTIYPGQEWNREDVYRLVKM